MFRIRLLGDIPELRTLIDMHSVQYVTEDTIESQEEGLLKVVLFGFSNGMKMTAYDLDRDTVERFMHCRKMGLENDYEPSNS